MALPAAAVLALAVAAALGLDLGPAGAGPAAASAPTTGKSDTAIKAEAAMAPAGSAAPQRRPVLLTGEVEALDSQTITVPPSNSAPLTLRNFVAEGTHVKAGDVVLRIETGGAANICLLYTSPSPRDQRGSRMPSSA